MVIRIFVLITNLVYPAVRFEQVLPSLLSKLRSSLEVEERDTLEERMD